MVLAAAGGKTQILVLLGSLFFFSFFFVMELFKTTLLSLLLPGISHKELVDAARQHFSGLPFAYKEDAVPVLPRCRFTGSEVKLFGSLTKTRRWCQTAE